MTDSALEHCHEEFGSKAPDKPLWNVRSRALRVTRLSVVFQKLHIIWLGTSRLGIHAPALAAAWDDT